MTDLPRLQTVPSVARQLGVGIRQLRAAIDRGELHPIDVGAWPRLDVAEVRRWLLSLERDRLCEAANDA